MNKIVKKTLCFGMIGTMMMGTLTGCGSGDDSSKESSGTITLHILENDTAKKEGYLTELLDAFNEEYKDKGIEAVDANMDEYTDLAANGPYGYGPDIIYQANDKLMTFAGNKHIMPIDIESLDCYDKIPEAAWDAFKLTDDGKEYCCGVPVNIQEPMLFYREDKMPQNWQKDWDKDGNGVADFFENWNDMYAYSKQVRENDSSANKDSQYGYMASLNNLYLSSQFVLPFGGYIFGKSDDGTIDTEDIGFAAGDTVKGMSAMMQFASLMNEGCIDDTITLNRYEKLASGTYFCAVSTPDTFALFVEKLSLQYQSDGLSEDDSNAKAKENIKMIELPGKMPKDGDVTKSSQSMSDDDFMDTVVMGGVNGYGISSYTENKDACVEFVNFATSYDMVKKRVDMLGIAPTRQDVAKESGDTADMIFKNLSEGRISLMPSVKAIDQVWKPFETEVSDMAKDAFREKNGEKRKYESEDDIKKALEKIDKDVYDAIYTLKS